MTDGKDAKGGCQVEETVSVFIVDEAAFCSRPEQGKLIREVCRIRRLNRLEALRPLPRLGARDASEPENAIALPLLCTSYATCCARSSVQPVAFCICKMTSSNVWQLQL